MVQLLDQKETTLPRFDLWVTCHFMLAHVLDVTLFAAVGTMIVFREDTTVINLVLHAVLFSLLTEAPTRHATEATLGLDSAAVLTTRLTVNRYLEITK